VRNYSDKEWETFVGEWAEGLKPTYGYKFVECIGGAGDRGVDVKAFLEEPNQSNAQWDSYQCKHYQEPLQPSDIWRELGKLCYHTWQQSLTVPRLYKFVSPWGVSQKLSLLLKKPAELNGGLKLNWKGHCLKEISSKFEVPLEGDLLKYVEQFSFQIVGYLPVNQLIAEHAKTPFWFSRFDIALPERPSSPDPPVIPSAEEQRYVGQLLETYLDVEGPQFDSSRLSEYPKHHAHFNRSRVYFYEAEGLNRFTRDYLPGAFEKFKKHILAGVEDIYAREYNTALDRLNATIEAARTTQIPRDHLSSVATPGDHKGACHHLANEHKLTWKQ
jgi:hypothetical protein